MTGGAHERGRWTQRWSLAILLAAVLVVAAATAIGLLYIDSAGEALIDRQERQAVESELDFLSEVQIDEGDAGLARSVSRRARIETQGGIFALKDAAGRIVAGNLAAWPEGVGEQTDWRVAEDVPGRGRVHLASALLEHGYVVLTGRDNSAHVAFRRQLFAAALLALGIVAATCLLLGALATDAVLRRVRRLSAASIKVSAGDFSARAADDADDTGPFGEIARAQNAMLDRIENLVVGLRTVTDSLAHDLRTPLARLRQTLERGLLDEAPGARQDALVDALAETDRTIATFSSLVDVARAVGGLSSEAMSTTDLAAIVGDAVDLFEPLAEERGMRLIAQVEPATAVAHRPLLMQAVSNLVHNAIKYGPEGGEIAVDLKRGDSEIEITVADHGRGIPEDRRRDAVERFHRLKAEGADVDGLGLGLAIVEACARLHGGALFLEDNAPGLKARFTIKTPEPAKGPPLAAFSREKPGLRRLRFR